LLTCDFWSSTPLLFSHLSCLVLLPCDCSLVLNAGSGLFYEAAVEAAYPIGEVSISALMTFVFNAASAIYLIVTSKISPQAMNWVLTGCCGACGLGLFLFKEVKSREQLDKKSRASFVEMGE
jgi:hypothetical protein